MLECTRVLVMVEKALKTLVPLLSETKLSRIASVVANRTNSIAVLLENVTDMGNEHAIIRSMDALGVQNLHSVKWGETVDAQRHKSSQFTSRTDSGSRKWITVHSWNNLSVCVERLKREGGYQVAVASPSAELSISELDCTQRLVLAFGNENSGVSEQLTELADIAFSLPMCGFVQSYNVSVSAAISLYHTYSQRVEKLGRNGDLNEVEKSELTLRFIGLSLGMDTEQLHSVFDIPLTRNHFH